MATIGYVVLYIAFAGVALWLLMEALWQHGAPFRYRLLALIGFVGVAGGVVIGNLIAIGFGVFCFAVGQFLTTRNVRAGYSHGWTFGGKRRPKGRRSRSRTAPEPGGDDVKPVGRIASDGTYQEFDDDGVLVSPAGAPEAGTAEFTGPVLSGVVYDASGVQYQPEPQQQFENQPEYQPDYQAAAGGEYAGYGDAYAQYTPQYGQPYTEAQPQEYAAAGYHPYADYLAPEAAAQGGYAQQQYGQDPGAYGHYVQQDPLGQDPLGQQYGDPGAYGRPQEQQYVYPGDAGQGGQADAYPPPPGYPPPGA